MTLHGVVGRVEFKGVQRLRYLIHPVVCCLLFQRLRCGSVQVTAPMFWHVWQTNYAPNVIVRCEAWLSHRRLTMLKSVSIKIVASGRAIARI